MIEKVFGFTPPGDLSQQPRSSKKTPLQITREGWLSMNTFTDRVVPSLEYFGNGNLLSVMVVGEEPVSLA